jgi:enediyne biosynthesis protein E3
MTTLGSIRRRLFGISAPRKVFSQPGFAPEGWARFAPVIESLAQGYNMSLEDSSLAMLVPRLEAVEPTLHGFAYEGAGMGLGALDLITPWKQRLGAFVAGPGGRHIATVYVGLGLALARLRRRPERYLDRLDPLLGWAIVDGYGFHEGFFARRRSIVKQMRPAHLSSHGRRMFDQGLGRAIWFSSGAVVARAAETIASFEPDRRADLWTGAGMACGYAGGTDRAGLDQLCDAAGAYRHRLSWAAATAAWTRDLAGNQAPHTDLACEVLCEISSTAAARILEQARHDLAGTSPSTSYQTWRRACTPALSERIPSEPT